MKRMAFTSLALALMACSSPSGSADGNTLAHVQNDITAALPDVTHISRAELSDWQRSRRGSILILDTRPEAEYAVAHIDGAQQVNPKTKADALLARFDVKDKDIVLYCSVGWRSSLLGDAAAKALLEAGARSVNNMEGGLFGWHNDGRALVNANGPTTAIHPYDDKWGQLIHNTEAARYTP